MEASEGPSTGDPTTRLSTPHGEQNASRNRRHARDRTPRTADVRSDMGADQHPPRRHYRQPKPAGDSPLASGSTAESGAPAVTVNGKPPSRRPKPKSRNPPGPPNTVDAKNPSISIQVNSNNDGKTRDRPRPGDGGFKRGGKFNAGLTEFDSAPPPVSKPTEKYRSKSKPSQVPPTLDDLTSRLTYALRTPPYPDCPICFSPIHPAQPIWSCSPSIPVIRPDDAESDEQQQYCWTAFHVKCIGSWATKSVKNIADAWRARGEEDRRGDWRCPGCQAKREVVPSRYWCFCNSTPEPKPARLATPHSCASPCSRVRETGCGHPCPLACHPGPCPPCQVTTQLECYCPKKTVLAFRCGVDRGSTKRTGRDLTCGSVCGRTLGCGKHTCERVCHDGDCDACAIGEVARCWCGKAEKEVSCGDGEAVVCSVENEEEWIGRFGCLDPCGRLFDCGTHKCQRPCHPPSRRPASCPSSPSKITHCPCGKRPIRLSPTAATVLTAFPARSHCTSPIPTCESSCDKPHPSCGHPCGVTCHTGPCPPCSFSMIRPCRCGGITRTVRCYELRPPDGGDNGEIVEILCEKPCAAVRTCGRHQCRRPCCPLASLASTTGKKGKKRADAELGVGEERGGLHECDLICGKVLSCGDHRCEEKDHKGGCPPCLRSSFEEMVCYCGRTVLEPPIPCGTQIQCKHQCSRPPPPCGHPRAQHSCHEGPSLCPPCPFLATKRCACGKKMVGNIRCSLETDKISCGTVCAKLMTCGFHHCERLCHGDVCGPCTAPCGKSRKLCLPAHHSCTQACHAPSICPEDEHCQSLLTLTCPCGRIRQVVLCGRSSSNAAGAQRTPPKCNNDCSIAQRNARLADALGITPGEKVSAVTYHEDLVTFAKADHKFLGLVEKAFVEFVNSNKKTQVLPHMPPERRQFVRSLAGVYRMDTEMVDQEPHRSVQLFRRLDTRVPTPLLSSVVVTPNPASSSLGKLVDMRGSATTLWRGTSTPSLSKLLPTPSASGPTRGWSSAATQPMPVAMTSRPAPTPISSMVTRLPTSAHVSRTSTPTPSAPGVVDTPDINVPDDWEDEV